MSLGEFLEACRDDPGCYAGPAERMLRAIGEPELVDTSRDPRLGRIFLNRTVRIYPAFAEFHGMEDTLERIVSFFRHAAQGLEERKQVLYLLGPVGGGKSSIGERLKLLMEQEPIYVSEGGRRAQPGFRKPARPVRPRHDGRRAAGAVRDPAPRAQRGCQPLGAEAAGRVGRRHRAVPRGQAVPVAPQADRHRQDRARRRQQPGHLRPGRQGRYPQARDVQPERPGRLWLLWRAEPRQPGHPRIRRDVQGADQDAASAADRDAGGQLPRHREHRRDPVQRHHAGALERGGVAKLPQQPHQ